MKHILFTVTLLFPYTAAQCSETTAPNMTSAFVNNNILHRMLDKYKKLTPQPFAEESEYRGTVYEAELKTQDEIWLGEKVKRWNVPHIESLRIAYEQKIATMVADLKTCGYNLDTQDENKNTALHLATHYKAPIVVSALIAHEANPNISDSEGKTPIMIACDLPDGAPVLKALLLYSPLSDENKKYLISHVSAIPEQSLRKTAAIIHYFAQEKTEKINDDEEEDDDNDVHSCDDADDDDNARAGNSTHHYADSSDDSDDSSTTFNFTGTW